ncbi:hypothetical protein Glove_139g364 [Diversispora epigaea]|uniref:Uncharacterized protein n=1 Tax=Diversispora epigaea TaxID=1348612 RepID=A0A397J1R9_9GLOM|nr:hypothetical protein Glove_139g364 [Diversispora epigaea]
MQFCQVKLQMLTDTTTITTKKTIVSVTSITDDNNIDNNDLIQNNKQSATAITGLDNHTVAVCPEQRVKLRQSVPLN